MKIYGLMRSRAGNAHQTVRQRWRDAILSGLAYGYAEKAAHALVSSGCSRVYLVIPTIVNTF